jgi:membrane protein required for colicin V production
MNFTYVDGAVAIVTLVSAFLAYNRGFTRELFAIGGWILAALAAFYFAPMVEPLIRELPVVGERLADSCIISMIVAFTLVVALALLVLAVFTPIFASIVLESALGPVDRVLGFLFGVARGIALIAIAYMIYGYISVDNFEEALANPEVSATFNEPLIDDSASKQFLDEAAAVIDENRPDELPGWFTARIDALMAPCQGGATPQDAAGNGGTTGTATQN